MKQFNVYDETHKLGRELSLRTGKSLLIVVSEALKLYRDKIEGSVKENDLLLRAVTVIEERMCLVVHEEVSHAIDEVVRLQEEMREKRAKELEQLLREATPEAPEDDLKEVPYEELYGAR